MATQAEKLIKSYKKIAKVAKTKKVELKMLGMIREIEIKDGTIFSLDDIKDFFKSNRYIV